MECNRRGERFWTDATLEADKRYCVGNATLRPNMSTHYFHLSAFTCGDCDGPVISGSVATRETEIQRETNTRQIGSLCLCCGRRHLGLPASGVVRHMAPFEWSSVNAANKNETRTASDSVSVV